MWFVSLKVLEATLCVGVKTKRPTRNPVCVREIPVKVCGVCPCRQKILCTALSQLPLHNPLVGSLFALVTRRPYCPWRPKKLCFTRLSLIPMVSIVRLSMVKQSFFGLPGQYGRRVTRVNPESTR